MINTVIGEVAFLFLLSLCLRLFVGLKFLRNPLFCLRRTRNLGRQGTHCERWRPRNQEHRTPARLCELGGSLSFSGRPLSHLSNACVGWDYPWGPFPAQTGHTAIQTPVLESLWDSAQPRSSYHPWGPDSVSSQLYQDRPIGYQHAQSPVPGTGAWSIILSRMNEWTPLSEWMPPVTPEGWTGLVSCSINI